MMTCLDRATEAYLRHRGDDRSIRMRECAVLAEYEVFSNRALEAITGLPENVVRGITQKTTHTGGRLAPPTLPLIRHFRDDARDGVLNQHVLRDIVALGTSAGMVARLAEVPLKDVRRVAGV